MTARARMYNITVATFRKFMYYIYASDKCRQNVEFFSQHVNLSRFGTGQIGKRISLVSMRQLELSAQISTFTSIFIGIRDCPWSSEWKIISRVGLTTPFVGLSADFRAVRYRCSGVNAVNGSSATGRRLGL